MMEFAIAALWPFAFMVSVFLIALVAEQYVKRDHKDIEILKDELIALIDRIKIIEVNHIEVRKQAEQVQKIISTSNLAAAFTPRK